MSAGKIGDLLVLKGVITKDQLASAVEHRQKFKTRLSQSFIQLGHVNEQVLAKFLSQQYGISLISLEGKKIPPELVKLVPKNICERHHLIPILLENNKVSIAMSDPTNVSAIDDVRFLCNLDVQVFVATESQIQKLMTEAYGAGKADPKATAAGGTAPGSPASLAAKNFQSDIKQLTTLDAGEAKSGIKLSQAKVEVEDIEAGGDNPIIRIINKVFQEAIKRKVSDIHIEPFETYTVVRFRVDGSLVEIMRAPLQAKTAIPARLKVMAQLDISEKRLPQDGRIALKTKDRKVDVRVSTLPTVHGEKVVMRLLAQSDSKPDLTKMGFEESQLTLLRKGSAQPYGMILVTGPTGSGKSTTLYALLSELNTPDINISTVEDPVEYNMPGINQVQMKESIGLNFSAALRSLLRQDPDIIMVGEIRDQETAEIAIKASLTGHLVFSTLHTNDAPSTITRLIHMGVEPFLITASLTLVQAQRLVRMNCPHCLIPDDRVQEKMLIEAEVPKEWIGQFTPMRGAGCEQCGGTGYKGRRGIYEVLYLTENIRSHIVDGANADKLKEEALKEGMITLRRSGVIKLFRGETTLEEVMNNSRPDGDMQ